MTKKIFIFTIVSILVFSLGAFAQNDGGYSIPYPVDRPDNLVMKGLDGDDPAWFTELYLTAEEVAKVREMNLKIAYEMPNQSEFSEAYLRGLEKATKDLNMQIVGLAVCENDPHVQKENMENFQALGVDIVMAQAQEVDLAARTFDPLKNAGIKLLFQGNVPTGYKAGVDYVGAVASDFYQYGNEAADALAESIGYEGKVAIIYLAAVNQVSNIRDQAFVDRIKSTYPNIELVEEAGIEAPVYASSVAAALLTRHADLDGLHVTFVEPATEALEVVRSLGMKDLKISTVDFNSIASLDLIRDGNIAVLIVSRPYISGQMMAMMAAYGALGKELTSSTYMGPIVAVNAENIEEEWFASFGVELPRELKQALEMK